MKSSSTAAIVAALACLLSVSQAFAAPTSVSITIPLTFGGHRAHEPQRFTTAGEIRTERRLRYARYGLQLADAIVSAIGYHAYARCLSCFAYPGGGPRGGVPVSIATFEGGRPAEADPLIEPFSRGGFGSLVVAALAYDALDARVEGRWSVARRTSADLAEIGAHVWGISTWLPEIKNIDRSTAIAQACGAEWQAKRYGEAFSNGCVNAYYRPGAPPSGSSLPAGAVNFVCAPAQFKRGTYLFATQADYIVSSGVPCTDVFSPFHSGGT
jgi:hypothetical protein